MALNDSESPDSSSAFGLLKASFSKFRGPPSGRAGPNELRRSSIDSSGLQNGSFEPSENRSNRRASVSLPLHPHGRHTSASSGDLLPRDHTTRQIRSIVQEISDSPYPQRPRSRNEWPPERQSKLPPPVVPPPTDPRKPDPKLVIAALTQMPHIGAVTAQTLDVHEQMIVHQLDQLDAEQRNQVRYSAAHPPPPSSSSSQPRAPSSVFGVSLRKSNVYASTSVLLGGRELELPIVVVSCIEELYRTGLYQPDLFRTLPNPCRLRELVDAFNQEEVPADIIITPRPKAAKRRLGTAFGGHISLHLEATADICSLLSTYLMSLPGPVFTPENGLFDAMWEWCGMVETDGEGAGVEGVPHDGKHVPFARANAYQVSEHDKVRTAQLMLHLLPSANFDLLVYLLAFFSQVVLVEKENGLGIRDLAKMFGENLFGSAGGVDGKGERVKQEDGRGARMMCWLLKRWNRLSHRLFDISRPRNLDPQQPNTEGPGKSRTPPFFSILSSLETDAGYTRQPGVEDTLIRGAGTGRSSSEDGAPTTISDSSTYTYPKDSESWVDQRRGSSDRSTSSTASTSQSKDRARAQAMSTLTKGATRGPLNDLGDSEKNFGDPKTSSPYGKRDAVLDDIVKSYEVVEPPTASEVATTVVLPLHIKGKQAYVEVKTIDDDAKHAPHASPGVMVPLLTTQDSEMSTNSTADLCARLMDITMSDLVHNVGPDPTAILTQNERKRKESRIPSSKTSLPLPQAPSGRVGGHRESGRRANIYQLEEELQLVKEQNAQALGALEQATKQITSLEAKLKDIDLDD